MPPPVPWPDERTERLKELHARGVPYPAIAAELGVPKNAVVGKVSRLGLAKHVKPQLGLAEATAAAEAKARAKAPAGNGRGAVRVNAKRSAVTATTFTDAVGPNTEPQDIRDLPPDASEFAVSLADAREDQCRYPLGDAVADFGAFRFCGAEKIEGASYCARHLRACTGKPYSPRRPFQPQRR